MLIELVWLSYTVGKSAEQQICILSKLRFLWLTQVLGKLFCSISSDKTYNHRMVWQSTRMEHTQRKDRSIPGVLLLANMHGRCLFHALPFDGQLWCQIELYLMKQFHFLLLWHFQVLPHPEENLWRAACQYYLHFRDFSFKNLKKKYWKHWRIMKITCFFAALFLLDLFACCHAYLQYPLPDIDDAKFIEDCVRAHNTFRSKVKPPASNMLRMVRRHSWSVWKLI